MSSPPLEVKINEWELRAKFHSNGLWYRHLQGEFRAAIFSEGLADPENNQLPLTESQGVAYFDAEDNEVARVHQYILPDGTLGGKMMPDPKRLKLDGVLYVEIGKKHLRIWKRPARQR